MSTKTTRLQIVGVAICLRDSPRNARLMDELRRAGIFDITYIYYSDRDVEDGVRGCFQAHQRALEWIIGMEGCKDDTIILVMEDDVEFDLDGQRTVLDAVAEAGFALHDKVADVIAVGAVPITPMRKVEQHPNIRSALWQMTHAYVLTAVTARQIVGWTFKRHERALRLHDHYDQQLSRRLSQALVHPTMAYQVPTADLTTTNRQWLYVFLMFMRNLVRQRNVQRVSEHFMTVMARLIPAY